MTKSGGHKYGFLPAAESALQPDVKLMSTHLFSSVNGTGTQNMVKDWDAKISLENMENQLGKYTSSWHPCAVEYLLFLSTALNSDVKHAIPYCAVNSSKLYSTIWYCAIYTSDVKSVF